MERTRTHNTRRETLRGLGNHDGKIKRYPPILSPLKAVALLPLPRLFRFSKLQRLFFSHARPRGFLYNRTHRYHTPPIRARAGAERVHTTPHSLTPQKRSPQVSNAREREREEREDLYMVRAVSCAQRASDCRGLGRGTRARARGHEALAVTRRCGGAPGSVAHFAARVKAPRWVRSAAGATGELAARRRWPARCRRR